MRSPTPDDDYLHEPANDDIFWTETAWFAFAAPERKLSGCTYPVFRANQDICSSGVYIWDDSGEGDHEILFSHNYWHIPFPDKPTNLHLVSGLHYDVLEPLRKYRVRYESDEVNLELHYEGLVEPIMGIKGDHLDQPCKVTGMINLRGEDTPIDCFDMRDKSWHVRSDVNPDLPPDIAEGSYTYAINDDGAFIAWTTGRSADLTTMRGGWLLRDGEWSRLKSGERTAEREPGRPAHRTVVEGTDELGRSFHAVGTTFNNFAMRSTPALLAWLSGATFDLDGKPAVGQSQEWSPGSSMKARRLWLPEDDAVPAT